MNLIFSTRLKWFLGVLIYLVLLHAAFEILRRDKKTVLRCLRSCNCRDFVERESSEAEKLILFVTAGLRTDVFNLKGNRSQFYWELRDELGLHGAVHGSEREDPKLRLKELLTGFKGVRLCDCLESLLTNNNARFIGPPSFLPILIGADSHVYPREWENTTIYPFPRQLDQWIKEQAKRALDFDHWNLLIVYFPGLEVANRLEGVNSDLATEEVIYILETIGKLYKYNEAKNQSKSAYILTSDSFDSTTIVTWRESFYRTQPLVTWGSGFSNILDFPTKTPVQMYKTKNTDITPMISAILGTPIPVHSLGEIPLTCIKGEGSRAKAAFKNAKQLACLFSKFVKNAESTSANYFNHVTPETIQNQLVSVEHLIKTGEFESAKHNAQWICDLCEYGIEYYTHFERRHIILNAFISLLGLVGIFFGWTLSKIKLTPEIEMVLSPVVISEPNLNPESNNHCKMKRGNILDIIFCIFLIPIAYLLYIAGFTVPVIPSTLLLLSVIWLVGRHISKWIELHRQITGVPHRGSKAKPFVHFFFIVLWSLLLPYVLARSILFLWAILFTCLTDLRRKLRPYPSFWTVTSLPLMILFYYNFEKNFTLMISGMSIWIISVVTLMVYLEVKLLDWITISIFFLFASFPIANIHFFEIRLDWFVLPAFCIIVPLIGSSKLSIRILQIILGVSVCVFQQCEGIEPIVLIVLSIHLFSWLLIENSTGLSEFKDSTIRNCSGTIFLTWSDFRTVFYYVAYLMMSLTLPGTVSNVETWREELTTSKFNICNAYVIISSVMKNFPILILVNVVEIIIRRNYCFQHIELKLLVFSIISLFNFLIFPSDPWTLFKQGIFTGALLAEPLALLLLGPSLTEKIKERRTKNQMLNAKPQDDKNNNEELNT